MCSFDKNGICTALACYSSNEKCNARDENGSINYSDACENCGKYICKCD